MREKSRQTRERLLESAERLFAARGFNGASMRDITVAAKVNLSIAYYYFKNKEDLLLGCIEKYIFPMLKKEREMLEKARTEAGAGNPVPARRLLEAIMLPRVDALSDTSRALLALLQVRSEKISKTLLSGLEKLTEEVRAEFFGEFQKTFPQLSPDELRFRMVNMQSLFTGWKILQPFVESEHSKTISKATYMDMFLTMLEQMFSAPPSLPPSHSSGRENA